MLSNAHDHRHLPAHAPAAQQDVPTPGRRSFSEVESTRASKSQQRDTAERNARALLAQLESRHLPALEAAIASDRPAMPLVIVEVRIAMRRLDAELERMEKLRVKTHAELARAYAAVKPRLEEALQVHDAMATPTASTSAIQEWLRRDLATRADIDPADTWTHGMLPVRAEGEQPASEPKLPAGGSTREIELEVGKGKVSGSVKGTLEVGATGYGGSKGYGDKGNGDPLGEASIKAIKSSATMKLNGAISKIETSILNGEIDFEVVDGLKVAFELGGGKGSIEGDEQKLELLTIAIKVSGDVSHWLTQPGVKLAIEGQLEIDLSGPILDKLKEKFAAQLSKLNIARVEQDMLVHELEDIQKRMGDAAKRDQALAERRSQLETRRTKASASELAKIDADLAALDKDRANNKRMLADTAKHADEITDKLRIATRNVDEAALALERHGKQRMVGIISRSMARHGARLAARAFLKLLPVINVVSTIIDIVELVTKVNEVVRLIRSGKFSLTLFGEGGSKEEKPNKPKPSGDASQGKGPVTDPGGVDKSRGDSRNGKGKQPSGPITDPSQVDRAGGGNGEKSRGNAGRDKRTGNRDTGYRKPHGPITDPDQVLDLSDPWVVIDRFPHSIAKQWFVIENNLVVLSPVAKEWVRKYRNRQHGDLLVHDVTFSSSPFVPRLGTWDIAISFDYTKSGVRDRAPRNFWATPTREGLKLERYNMVGTVSGKAR